MATLTKSAKPLTIRTADEMTALRMLGLAMLAVRFVQGWIYWGGGSRRFIYDPSKLDPHAASWMANKFQSAMPGALLGMDKVVNFLLHHFVLLYAGVIIFSGLELIFGLFLIFGFMTRLSALVSIGLSVVLMLLFGWQGATCIDEWTMASAGIAMGVALFIAGSTAYSVDSWMLKRKPSLAQSGWFQWFGSGPWSPQRMQRWSLVSVVLTIMIVVLTYNDFRGSVLTPFHSSPVSPSKHHMSLSGATLTEHGAIQFTAYLDAGTPAEPSNVITAELLDASSHVVERWDGASLAALPKTAFANEYDYNKFGPGYAGMTAKVGARATISLPPAKKDLKLVAGIYKLILHSVNDNAYMLNVQLGHSTS
jgi:thiosulfate dehydrogenase [quinone] large subunit